MKGFPRWSLRPKMQRKPQSRVVQSFWTESPSDERMRSKKFLWKPLLAPQNPFQKNWVFNVGRSTSNTLQKFTFGWAKGHNALPSFNGIGFYVKKFRATGTKYPTPWWQFYETVRKEVEIAGQSLLGEMQDKFHSSKHTFPFITLIFKEEPIRSCRAQPTP